MNDVNNVVSDEEIMNFMEEFRAMAKTISNKEMNEHIFLLTKKKKLTSILGTNHGFDLVLNESLLFKECNWLSLMRNGKTVRSTLVSENFEFPLEFPLESHNDEFFKEFILRALKKLRSSDENEKRSFVTPSNQLKPFLTPGQEIGLE